VSRPGFGRRLVGKGITAIPAAEDDLSYGNFAVNFDCGEKQNTNKGVKHFCL
jgi:hypothetical protein